MASTIYIPGRFSASRKGSRSCDCTNSLFRDSQCKRLGELVKAPPNKNNFIEKILPPNIGQNVP